jgi:hypothetical protein
MKQKAPDRWAAGAELQDREGLYIERYRGHIGL